MFLFSSLEGADLHRNTEKLILPKLHLNYLDVQTLIIGPKL